MLPIAFFSRGKNIMGFTCTDGKFRYTEWWDNKAQKVIESELYLCNDDYSKQTQNFAKDLKYKKVLERMAKLLELQFPKNVISSYPQNDKAQNSNVKRQI